MIGYASPWLAFTIWLIIAIAAVLVVRLYCSVRGAEQQRGDRFDDLDSYYDQDDEPEEEQ